MPSRKAIPKGKVQINILISADLYKQLIEVAPAWYGKSKGAISAMVEEALRRYLTPLQHTASTHLNPKPTVRMVYAQVVEKIKEIEHLSIRPMEVPERILDLAIAEVRGSDPRTVAKWKNVFLKSGLIKFIAGFPPNRVVELL